MTLLEAKHEKLSRSFADIEGHVQKVRPGAFCLLQLLRNRDSFVACCNCLLTVLAVHIKAVPNLRVSESCVPLSQCLTLPGRVSFAFQLGFRLDMSALSRSVGSVWKGACVRCCHADVLLDDDVLLGNAEQGGAGGQDPGGEQPEE